MMLYAKKYGRVRCPSSKTMTITSQRSPRFKSSSLEYSSPSGRSGGLISRLKIWVKRSPRQITSRAKMSSGQTGSLTKCWTEKKYEVLHFEAVLEKNYNSAALSAQPLMTLKNLWSWSYVTSCNSCCDYALLTRPSLLPSPHCFQCARPDFWSRCAQALDGKTDPKNFFRCFFVCLFEQQILARIVIVLGRKNQLLLFYVTPTANENTP